MSEPKTRHPDAIKQDLDRRGEELKREKENYDRWLEEHKDKFERELAPDFEGQHTSAFLKSALRGNEIKQSIVRAAEEIRILEDELREVDPVTTVHETVHEIDEIGQFLPNEVIAMILRMGDVGLVARMRETRTEWRSEADRIFLEWCEQGYIRDPQTGERIQLAEPHLEPGALLFDLLATGGAVISDHPQIDPARVAAMLGTLPNLPPRGQKLWAQETVLPRLREFLPADYTILRALRERLPVFNATVDGTPFWSELKQILNHLLRLATAGRIRGTYDQMVPQRQVDMALTDAAYAVYLAHLISAGLAVIVNPNPTI